MKKLQTIIFCFCVFLFAQEDTSNKRRVSLGLRLGGGIGLSDVDKKYKAQIETPYEWEDEWEDEYWEKYVYSYGVKKWKDFTGSFDVAAFLSLQLTNIFAIQTETFFTRYCRYGYNHSGYWYEIYYKDGKQIERNDYETLYRFRKSKPVLIFPILAKLTFNPKNISIQTFVGPHFSVDFGYVQNKTNYNDIYKYFDRRDVSYPWIGLTAGGRFGIKATNGIVFLDVRYFTDLFTNKFEERDVYMLARRARLSLTAGYEFRLGSK